MTSSCLDSKDEITIYICSICETQFDTNNAVVLHMVEMHRDQQKIEGLLNEIPKIPRENKEAKRTYKKRTKEYKCSLCNYKTVHHSTYKRHLLTHSKKNSCMHKCPYCSYTSIQKHSLVRHITNLHPDGPPETIIIKRTTQEIESVKTMQVDVEQWRIFELCDFGAE